MSSAKRKRVVSMETKLNPLLKLDKGAGETSVEDGGRNFKNPEG